MSQSFDHEKLRVYQDALAFAAWASELIEKLPKGSAVRGQLDRASSSTVLNIAEGNGKFTAADRCKFLDIARGSALECAACLDLLVATGGMTGPEAAPGRKKLLGVVSMLVGLIRSISPTRIAEDAADYESEREEGEEEKEEE